MKGFDPAGQTTKLGVLLEAPNIDFRLTYLLVTIITTQKRRRANIMPTKLILLNSGVEGSQPKALTKQKASGSTDEARGDDSSDDVTEAEKGMKIKQEL